MYFVQSEVTTGRVLLDPGRFLSCERRGCNDVAPLRRFPMRFRPGPGWEGLRDERHVSRVTAKVGI